MHGSKLLVLLSALGPRELKRFQDFVHSPYFNKHEKLAALADYVCDRLSRNDTAALDRRSAFAFLYPSEAYHEQRLADLMSYLVQLLEQFLAIERWKKDDFNQPFHLMQELAHRNLDKQQGQVAHSLQRQQARRSFRNEDFHLQEYLYWNARDHYFMRQQHRTHDDSLQHKVDALDLFYLTAKLKNACEMVNREHVISVNYNYWLITELLNYLQHHVDDYHEHPLIRVYYHILQALMHPEDLGHYDRLKAVLTQVRPYFTHEKATPSQREEIRYMYLYVQNHIIHAINRGHKHFLRELFELYQWLLESGFILEGDRLSQWDYKNIVSAGHRLGEFEWTEQFIEKYKALLAPEVRENAYNYNLAVLLYQKQDYARALRLLQEVQFTDVYYSLGARVLLGRIYYERGDYDPLLSLLDAFQVYLKRNTKLPAYQETLHLNFIKLLRKLAHLKSRLDLNPRAVTPEHLAQLTRLMDDTPDAASHLWMQEELQRLATRVRN